MCSTDERGKRQSDQWVGFSRRYTTKLDEDNPTNTYQHTFAIRTFIYVYFKSFQAEDLRAKATEWQERSEAQERQSKSSVESYEKILQSKEVLNILIVMHFCLLYTLHLKGFKWSRCINKP